METKICRCCCHIKNCIVRYCPDCCIHAHKKYLDEDWNLKTTLDTNSYKDLALTEVIYNTGDVIHIDWQTKFVQRVFTHDGLKYEYEWEPKL